MKFRTASGSCYEVDVPNSRARRISGNHVCTDRQEADGVWRIYAQMSDPVVVGLPCTFLWVREETPLLPGSPPESHPGTMTSTVEEIFEEHEDACGLCLSGDKCEDYE